MLSVSDLRKNLKIKLDGQPWIVTDFDFCKPGKGQALYRCKLKNIITGSTMDRTWRPGDSLEKPDLNEREVTYMYHDGANYVFSDNETFEEVMIPGDVLGEQQDFLQENALCTILSFEDQPIEITLPIFVEMTVEFTEPAVRGNTATNVMKAAKLDGGAEIQVPLFVETGDVLKIDTRTGSYVERVKK